MSLKNQCLYCGGSLIKNGAVYTCKSCKSEFDEQDIAASRQPQAVADTQPAKRVDSVLDARGIWEKAHNGVMEITCGDKSKSICCGSGYMVTEDGYAVTNAHVVSGGDNEVYERIEANIAGERVPASVVLLGKTEKRPHEIDLALLKLERVPHNAIPLPIGNSEKVQVGDRVYTIGNSHGEGLSIGAGIVRALNRSSEHLIMHDCNTNPGNSGGPIFNNAGVVIGTHVSARHDAVGMMYAIPTIMLLKFLESEGKTDLNIHRQSASSCPRCGGNNTDKENGISYCYDCDYEW